MGANDTITTGNVSGTGVAIGTNAQSTVRPVDIPGGTYTEQQVNITNILNIFLSPEERRPYEAGGLPPDPDPAEGERRTRIAQLLQECATLPSWPEHVLRAAFQQSAPYHDLPSANSGSLITAIIDSLSENTLSHNLLDDFIRKVTSAPKLDPAHRAVLTRWLGEEPNNVSEPHMVHHPGLIIAIIPLTEPVPGSSQLSVPGYEMKLWRWPDGLLIDQVAQPVPQHELESRINDLYQRYYREIADLGPGATVEFFLPTNLMVEATHDWKLRIGYDEDPDDYDEIPAYKAHRVLVRSLDRARSQKDNMVNARARWISRWKALKALQLAEWCQPTPAQDAQCPPFYCPVTARDFDTNHLAGQLVNEQFLCFIETIAPPPSCAMDANVIRRVVRYGLPTGMWFAQGTLRQPGLYTDLADLLRQIRPIDLVYLPSRLNDWISKTQHGCRPILFFDNPERMPQLTYQFESIEQRKGDALGE